MGDVGIEEELDLKGIKYLGGPGDADHKVELKAGYAMPHDPDVRLLSACMLRQIEGTVAPLYLVVGTSPSVLSMLTSLFVSLFFSFFL